MKISDLEDKKIAMWGAGKEACSFLRFMERNYSGKTIIIYTDEPLLEDERKELFKINKNIILFDFDPIKSLNSCDIIIKSPGVSIYRPEITILQQKNCVITSTTNIWFLLNPNNKVVAITGTKGKSTSASLIYHLLSKLGRKVCLAGNIGMPLLDCQIDQETLVILELSSYQICDLEEGPSMAVLLNLYPEHIHWHLTHEQYYQDKVRLLLLPKIKKAFCNGCDALSKKYIVNNGINYFANECGIHIKNGFVYNKAQNLFQIPKDFPLLGKHHEQNLCAVLSVVNEFTDDLSRVVPFLDNFKPLPHRFEVIIASSGTKFINDSISTTPESSLAALKSLLGHNVIILLGGFDRQQDFVELLTYISLATKIYPIFFGALAPKLTMLYSSLCENKFSVEQHFENAFYEALKIKQEGDIILLSPAAPSYDEFRNFEERGNLFRKMIGDVHETSNYRLVP